MRREIRKTNDGLCTIYLPDLDECYHSTNGAYQEAMHVFIESGWKQITQDVISILEIGFGTGLNGILTLIQGGKENKSVKYVGLEAFPISDEEVNQLGYMQFPSISSYKSLYLQMHESEWGKEVGITPLFHLTKIKQSLEIYEPPINSFNLVYFDAFGPKVQPEMWTEEVFHKMFTSLQSGGILVTYSANGQVRRNLQAVGFHVERIPGPAGKREMLRATKS